MCLYPSSSLEENFLVNTEREQVDNPAAAPARATDSCRDLALGL